MMTRQFYNVFVGRTSTAKKVEFCFQSHFLIIQSPSDIIQPGSYGKWKEKEFKVLGRFRCWFAESVINYWTILFKDGELAYLAEGYGMYAIHKKTTVLANALNNFDYLQTANKSVLLTKQEYVLEKRNKADKWEIEGEVFLPECNSSFEVFDFSASIGKHITIFRFLPKSFVAYEVIYTSFQSLELSNTRNVDLSGKTFTCSKCTKPVTVKTFPYAQSCACITCGTHYSLKDGTFKTLNKQNEIDINPDIEIGSKGLIDGIEYECIGFALKEEANKYHSQWKEYTLYNSKEGYAFLSEYEGHWIFLREQGDNPVLSKPNDQWFDFGRERFQLFNSYNYFIRHARGEFPYNSFNNQETTAREFISPPKIWIREQNKREGLIWYSGKHISGKELEKQFNFPAGLPVKSGVGAVEPKFHMEPEKLFAAAFVAILILIFSHFALISSKEKKVLLDQTYLFNDSTDKIEAITPKFHFNKWSSIVQFDIHAAVDNDWFELNATLVNAKTGTEYNFQKGVEFYHGYSGGESWREGGTNETAYLTQIPEGDYFVQIQGIRNSGSYNKLHSFDLRLIYDVPSHRNLLWCMLLAIIWPVAQYIRSNQIEKKRWYNSPFSTYKYED